MKKNIFLSLWTIFTLLAGMMAACSEDEEMTLTPQQQYMTQLTKQVAGSWLADLDGTDYDIGFVELKLSEQQQASSFGFWIYDQEADKYAQFSLPITYQVVSNTTNGTSNEVLHLVIDTTAFYTQNPELRTVKLDNTSIDYSIKRVDNDSLCVNVTGNADSYLAFSKEVFDETKTDKDRIQQLNKEITSRMESENDQSDETDYYSFPDPEDEEYIAQNYPQSAAPARYAVANRTVANRAAANNAEPFFKLDSWMSKVDDEELICNLCIPSAHDCTTYNIRKVMTPFGISQAVDLKEQFRRGVRVFDLRIRNRFSNTANYCFHDCLDCNTEFTDALDDIVEMVTAEGSQEGAIVWISPEKNKIFGWYLSEIFTPLIDDLTALDFDSSDLDRPACVKKAVTEIKEHLLNKGCLATFKRDMKMKDLRRKVMVMFEKPTEEGETVDWGELAGYIAVKDDYLMRPDGKEVAEIHTQNDWGQEKEGQTINEFVQLKKRKFIDMMHGCAAKRDTTWIFNACNAYFWDPWPLPNYSECAAKTYPTFTKHLNKTRTRGIFQTDYCGVNQFTRIRLDQLTEISTTKLFTRLFGINSLEVLAIIELSYKLAVAKKEPDNVNSSILIHSMIYNNFRTFR